MDEIAAYNLARWNTLAAEGSIHTRPRLDFTPESARADVDPFGVFGDVTGKRVLCLASGGGQQSAAFAILGASVTVTDLSPAQLERDRLAARHYGLEVGTVAADMRDLSSLSVVEFDIVFHPYSLNFVADAAVVFQEVSRVIKPGGIYYLCCANPFFMDMEGKLLSGGGYRLSRSYIAGEAILTETGTSVFPDNISRPAVPDCREYRHTLPQLINGLAECGFRIIRFDDKCWTRPDPIAEPGSWQHFCSIAPPAIAFWSILEPSVSLTPHVRPPV